MEDLFNVNSALTSSETNFIDQGKDITDIDELIISQECPTLIIFLIAIISPLFLFFPLLFIPNKRVVILDSVKKKIIFCEKNIFGCNLGMKKKIYDYSQIKRIKLYLSSRQDEERPFDRLYFINCDIFSFDGLQDSLFSSLNYDESKFNNFVKTFEKHLNIEVETMEAHKKNSILGDTDDNQMTPNNNN